MSGHFLIYGEFAGRYDQHTPPRHYHHDHEFVLGLVRVLAQPVRLLDIGCGTGVFIEKAIAAGVDAYGLDPAPAMLKEAAKRVPEDRLILGVMQDLSCISRYDVITAFSWSFNYCADLTEAGETLSRCYKALKPGGFCVFQIAHAPNAAGEPGEFMMDFEEGPGGAEDIVFRYRFWSTEVRKLIAEYSFECVSLREHFQERHELCVADAFAVADAARESGFTEVALLADHSGVTFESSRKGTISPFLIAKRPL